MHNFDACPRASSHALSPAVVEAGVTRSPRINKTRDFSKTARNLPYLTDVHRFVLFRRGEAWGDILGIRALDGVLARDRPSVTGWFLPVRTGRTVSDYRAILHCWIKLLWLKTRCPADVVRMGPASFCYPWPDLSWASHTRFQVV
jgi:hypothetical protein